MFEHIYLISFITFSLLSAYLLTRIKMIPASKTGLIERFGVYYKPASPGIHFLVPFVDKMILFDVNRKLHLNREIITINGEPRLSISMVVDYRVIDEKDYHDQNVDQFMKDRLIEVTKNYIDTYGTSIIFEQRIALKTRLKGAILEHVINWGIELVDLDLVMVMEIPRYQN
jgi:regulator of protease activity HflC (stomatin/prohibitin superfamily)